MDDKELLGFFVTTIALVFPYEGYCFVFDNILICDQSSVELFCPNQTIITEVNISSPRSTLNKNVCTIPNDDTGLVSQNETISEQCIGKHSCLISGAAINFTQIPDQTWKLKVRYKCNDYLKTPNSVCHNNIDRVRCGMLTRKVYIQSVQLEIEEESVCRNVSESWCADVFEERIKANCDARQHCYNINKLDSDWKTCSRISKYVNVSFSCLGEEYTMNILPKESYLDKTLGIVVSVVSGLAIIGLSGAIYICFMRLKKHKRQTNIKNNARDYVDIFFEQQNIAVHAYDSLSLPLRKGGSSKTKQNGKMLNDTTQIWSEDKYESAESTKNDEQSGHQYLELELKNEYGLVGATNKPISVISSTKISNISK